MKKLNMVKLLFLLSETETQYSCRPAPSSLKVDRKCDLHQKAFSSAVSRYLGRCHGIWDDVMAQWQPPRLMCTCKSITDLGHFSWPWSLNLSSGIYGLTWWSFLCYRSKRFSFLILNRGAFIAFSCALVLKRNHHFDARGAFLSSLSSRLSVKERKILDSHCL